MSRSYSSTIASKASALRAARIHTSTGPQHAFGDDTNAAEVDRRLKILFLAHRVPHPPNRGDRIRSYHVLRHLAARHEVHLATLADEPVATDSLEFFHSHCRRTAIAPAGRVTRWLRGAWSMARGRTATEGLFSSPQLHRVVGGWSTETRFDLVFAVCSSMAQYAESPALQDVPLIVDLIDVDSQKWLDYAAHSRLIRRSLYGCEGRRLRAVETGLARRAAAILLVSEAEVDLWRQFAPGERVTAVGNGVDLAYFQPPADLTRDASRECVFVGALDYRANIDAVTWFCREVWPLVREREPAATLTLVGRRPTAAVGRLARLPGVAIAADVPDVRPYVARAALALAPLRIARGVQNKILEALAMGAAVVASPQALEGMNLQSNVEVAPAATPVEWGDTVVSLLNDPAARRRMGASGRQFVEDHHSWSQRLAPLTNVLTSALGAFNG